MMKKQALILTAALVTLCMAGCSENAKTADTTTTTAAAAAPAETTTAAETTTKAAETTTETTTAKAELTLPDERLFGGYVAAEAEAELVSEPGENGDTLLQIPSGTQLDIYDSGKSGWYMVKYEETIGFIRKECIEEIPAYDEGAFSERLFRGYVTSSDKLEYLMSEPDENSDIVEELTYGTMLEIYSCDTEGWYRAELGGELTGYVKADFIEEMPHRLPFGDRLFGGYVVSEGATGLMADADENSDVLRELQPGTILDLYESDCDGWYMTALINADNIYDTGFIKAESVAETPADVYEPTLKDIAGNWIYEVQDAGNTEEYVGMPVGYYMIDENGLYAYTTDGIEFSKGTVGALYEEYEDGSLVPWFTFSDANGEIFMGVAAIPTEERTDGCLYIGQDGVERLVPDYGNAIAGTDNYSVPNEYGFYELIDPPVSGVSIAALSGTWYNADDPTETVVITSEDDIYSGRFSGTDNNGVSANGYIKLEYALNPDNTPTFWYTFYLDNGTLWTGFSVSGDIPLNDLYSGQDGALHLVRSEIPDVSEIAGVWDEADVLDSRQLIIDAGTATFQLIYRGGGSMFGDIRAEYSENPDGSRSLWYNFYDNGGDFWEGFQMPDETPINDLYAGNGGEPHFVREQ